MPDEMLQLKRRTVISSRDAQQKRHCSTASSIGYAVEGKTIDNVVHRSAATKIFFKYIFPKFQKRQVRPRSVRQADVFEFLIDLKLPNVALQKQSRCVVVQSVAEDCTDEFAPSRLLKTFSI